MLKLNMRQQPAKLDLNITNPKIHLKTTPPKIKLTTEPTIVEIRRVEGKLEIDQYPCRYSIGFKNNTDLSYDFAQEGKRLALEAIGQIAAEGDRIASIESGENAIANIAAEANFLEPPDITWARIELPNFNYQPGKVEFNPIRGKVNLELERGTVDLELQRGEVRGSIAQYQKIRFWTTEGKFDMTI